MKWASIFSVTLMVPSRATTMWESKFSMRISLALAAAAQAREMTARTRRERWRSAATTDRSGRCTKLRDELRKDSSDMTDERSRVHAEAAGVLKLTLGASRSAAAVTSKNSRGLKPSILAKILVGNCWILVLRSRTTAL